MNLKSKCEELGITLAEGKEKYGLTHWKQTVVEEDVSVETESKEEVVVEAPVIETKSKVTQADKIKSCRGLGTKSPHWSELNG